MYCTQVLKSYLKLETDVILVATDSVVSSLATSSTNACLLGDRGRNQRVQIRRMKLASEAVRPAWAVWSAHWPTPTTPVHWLRLSGTSARLAAAASCSTSSRLDYCISNNERVVPTSDKLCLKDHWKACSAWDWNSACRQLANIVFSQIGCTKNAFAVTSPLIYRKWRYF